MVEHVAAHLGLDGTEVRQRNFWRPEGVDLPQVLPAVEPTPTLKPSVQEIAETPQVGPRPGLCLISENCLKIAEAREVGPRPELCAMGSAIWAFFVAGRGAHHVSQHPALMWSDSRFFCLKKDCHSCRGQPSHKSCAATGWQARTIRLSTSLSRCELYLQNGHSGAVSGWCLQVLAPTCSK